MITNRVLLSPSISPFSEWNSICAFRLFMKYSIDENAIFTVTYQIEAVVVWVQSKLKCKFSYESGLTVQYSKSNSNK